MKRQINYLPDLRKLTFPQSTYRNLRRSLLQLLNLNQLKKHKSLLIYKSKKIQIGIIATIFLCVICICLVVFNPGSGGGSNSTPTAPAFTSPTQRPSIQLPTQPQQSVCSPSYPTTCLNNNPRLNCVELRAKGIERFQVLSPDPLGYDTDGDGIGCE